MVVVHTGLSAVSDCAMVRVKNGMQQLTTKENLELRQVVQSMHVRCCNICCFYLLGRCGCSVEKST